MGTAYANKAVTECDLLIALGARFDDRVTGKIEGFAPKAKIIHIDIDPAELGKNVSVDIAIKGDVRQIIEQLYEFVKPKQNEDWKSEVEQWKKEYPLKYCPKGLKTSICNSRDMPTNKWKRNCCHRSWPAPECGLLNTINLKNLGALYLPADWVHGL